MRILRGLTPMAPCVLVLGMFDGVHRGHQALLMAGLARAQEAGVPLCVGTFEPHPLAVLKPERQPPRLTTQTERAQLMASYGVDVLCVLPFTRALASMPPEDFVREMVTAAHPVAIVTGFNYTFGDRGSGDCHTLAALSGRYGYECVTVPEVVLDGATVSSTRIRRLLQAGELRAATHLLGHAYTLAGRVEGGKHIGRTLGFPTANVRISPRKALPAFGVYFCFLTVDDESWPAVVNVGRHPTLPEGHVTVEAYVLDGAMNLYGKMVRLTFLRYQRPERSFESVEELQRQIARDAEEARNFFAGLV